MMREKPLGESPQTIAFPPPPQPPKVSNNAVRAQAHMERKSRESADKGVDSGAPSPRARSALLALFGSIGLCACLYFAYTYYISPVPTRISASDAETVQRVFFGGAPSVILCEGGDALAAAGDSTVALARSLKVPAYRIDCTAPLGGADGKSTFDRMGVDASWDPAAFIVARGRLVEQLHPTFIEDGGVAKAASRLKKEKKVKIAHVRVDNGVDLDKCLGNALKGCVLAYSSKDAGPAAGELVASVRSHPAVQFALVSASQRALRTSAPELEVVLRGAVAGAKAAAGGGKGTVLISLRRVPKSFAGGESNGLLALIRPTAGGTDMPADVNALLEASAGAWSDLKLLADAGGTDEKEARDGALSPTGALLVFRNDITIKKVVAEGRKPDSQASQAPPQTNEDAPADEEDAAAARERELDARRRMAEAEKDSAHYAAPADDREESDEDAGASAIIPEGTQEEEIDLDDGGDL